MPRPVQGESLVTRSFVWVLLLLGLHAFSSSGSAQPPVQEIWRSSYRLAGASGPLGSTELTEFRRADGSRSYLARERMEFWGPVLDRFVVLTFDARNHFDSGHWVGTSAYSPAFTYAMRYVGGAIRGDWDDTVRGRGWSEVPSRPENPVMGFWGPLEARLLARFDPAGPPRQEFDAVDVEDSHHRLLKVSVQRLAEETIDVPAGRFRATHYRSERFGPTDHWVDANGTLIRWVSEDGAYRWDLDRYPSSDPPERRGDDIAAGTYDVTSASGRLSGSVPWTLTRASDGDIHLVARESLNQRTSRFDGVLDKDWHWKGSTETVRWQQGEGAAPPEVHHLETFFYREQAHLLRFRDRAYPLLQTRAARAPVAFYDLDYPVSAMIWLRQVPRLTGAEQRLPPLAHIGNRYRGGGLEIQDAAITYLGATPVDGAPEESGHHFVLRYPGGWDDTTSEFWTDGRFVPHRVTIVAGERIDFRLRDYRMLAERALPQAAGRE